MPAPTLPIFDPTPAQADLILAALADPTRTLSGIADEHKTSLEAITLWMVRPDIAARLHNLQSAAIARTRLIALAYLPSVVPVLASVIDDYTEQLKTPRRPGPVDPATAGERRRTTDGARKAITLLTNLTRLVPPPQPQSQPQSPPPSQAAPALHAASTPPPPPAPTHSATPPRHHSAPAQTHKTTDIRTPVQHRPAASSPHLTPPRLNDQPVGQPVGWIAPSG